MALLTLSPIFERKFPSILGRLFFPAAKPDLIEKKTVVVIGAGLGGLCCAAFLARNGNPVTLIEQHCIPGGYATTFTRTGGKYCFDVSLHAISINRNITEDILRKTGVLERIDLIALPEMCRLISPGYDLILPQHDPTSYIRLLGEHFPSEVRGIERFVTLIVKLAKEVNRWHQRGARTVKLFFPFQYPHMWNVRHKTLADLLDRYIRVAELKHILSALWVYFGLPPSRMSGFYFGFATGDYLQNGSYYIKERSQNLSKAFTSVIEENQGELIYNTRVNKIMVQDNRVTGVRTDSGQVINAGAVISNASAVATFEQMLPKEVVPKDYLTRLRRFKPSLSSFIIWLGVNGELRDKIQGGDIYIYTGRGPEAEYQASVTGDIENTAFAVSIYDNIFEGYSCNGTTTLMVVVLSGYDPWKPFEKDYHQGEKTAYRKMKKKWADVLLQRTEKHVIPGLRGMIEICVTATPLTNQRYTGNPHGAIYGFEQSLDNAFMNRIKNRTPINGLYLAGAWTFPGGGYTGVLLSGEKAYHELMADRKGKG